MGKTVLSVRDFAILLDITNREIFRLREIPFVYLEKKAERQKREEEHKKDLQESVLYQDLMRIREKLGELNIEIETPSVEIKE